MVVDVYTDAVLLKRTKISDIPKRISLAGKAYNLEGLVLYKPPAPKTRAVLKEHDENAVQYSSLICHYTAAILDENGRLYEIDDLNTKETKLKAILAIPHVIIYSEKFDQ